MEDWLLYLTQENELSFLLKQFVTITDKNIMLSGSQVTLQPEVVAVVITVTTQEKGSGFESPGIFLHVLPMTVWFSLHNPASCHSPKTHI